MSIDRQERQRLVDEANSLLSRAKAISAENRDCLQDLHVIVRGVSELRKSIKERTADSGLVDTAIDAVLLDAFSVARTKMLSIAKIVLPEVAEAQKFVDGFDKFEDLKK